MWPRALSVVLLALLPLVAHAQGNPHEAREVAERIKPCLEAATEMPVSVTERGPYADLHVADVTIAVGRVERDPRARSHGVVFYRRDDPDLLPMTLGFEDECLGCLRFARGEARGCFAALWPPR